LKVVRVATDPPYDVRIGRGVLADVAAETARYSRRAVLTDDVVAPLYLARLGLPAVPSLAVRAGEAAKSFPVLERVLEFMAESDLDRGSCLIALGGGVVGDLAGFVAATFMRGVPFVQLPTTLLAMIDASVGGKTGVDTVAGKNLVGAFHQPSAVIVDTSVLATLPREHLRAGMAEAIKHGVIASEAYFDSVVALAEHLDTVDVAGDAMLDLVAGSIEIKADVVRRDEREAGVRKTLNFGHTLGHAVELCSGYGVLHGEAVAIGMVYEAAVAERLGIAAPRTASRVRQAIVSAGLSDTLPASITSNEVVAATRGDKKARAGQAEYALPAAVGEMNQAQGRWSVPVNEATVLEVLA
jgi:3-dehydroquinate synthase